MQTITENMINDLFQNITVLRGIKQYNKYSFSMDFYEKIYNTARSFYLVLNLLDDDNIKAKVYGRF